MNERELTKIISLNIFKVIELCYTQGVTTTWRDIYLFLRIPNEIWEDDLDLDEKIIVKDDAELEIFKEMLTAKFETKH